MSDRFSARLGQWWGRSRDELPEELRLLVDRFPYGWDTLTSDQRRDIAKQLDLQQRPTPAQAADLELGFREAVRRLAQQRNAKRPRPNARRIPDAAIVRAKARVSAEGVTLPHQCRAAYDYLRPALSLRRFRAAWNRLRLNRKKGR